MKNYSVRKEGQNNKLDYNKIGILNWRKWVRENISDTVAEFKIASKTENYFINLLRLYLYIFFQNEFGNSIALVFAHHSNLKLAKYWSMCLSMMKRKIWIFLFNNV